MTTHRIEPQIVVIGAGIAGLESAFALRSKLGSHAQITLLTDQDYFLFKPHLVYVPFGMSVERVSLSLSKPTRRAGIDLFVTHVYGVDPITKRVSTDAGDFAYDYLIVASGAGIAPSTVPGLTEHAYSVWTMREMLRLRRAFLGLSEDARAGEKREVVFALPEQPRCPTPIYELALMLDTWLRRQRLNDHVHLTFVTGEHQYMQDFGLQMHDLALTEFEKRHIDHYSHAPIAEVTPTHAQLVNGAQFRYDLLITFPQQAASIRFDSLPTDDSGFISVYDESRQVKGINGVYAVGDASDFPFKMGYLAASQAEAAADHLSAQILGHSPQTHFEPTTIVMVDTLDRAAFARVPLNSSGKSRYRMGFSPTWSMSKQVLGVYVPWRISAGKPYSSGLPYRGMAFGLKALTGLFAHPREKIPS